MRNDSAGAGFGNPRLRREKSFYKKAFWGFPAALIRRSSRRSLAKRSARKMFCAVMMPSPFSSEGSVKDSEKLAEKSRNADATRTDFRRV
jgi:hypothetical protein